VRFVSEQENILRAIETIVAGDGVTGAPGKIEEITDLWVFAHDAKSSNADWQVVETKS
jgi:predicted lipid-binding transport protein (Tim44 family)